ncbi:hypothetical protein LCGC14_1322620 [marine sediment metagenome]|uniref:Uncharacterized protein n=1 Tax=marine sediment metagenome TaxID=412755 RepID=A0A0F9KJ18_9ZZZZ
MTTIQEQVSRRFILPDLPWIDIRFQLEAAAAAQRARSTDDAWRIETRWRITDWTRGDPIPETDRLVAAAAYMVGEWRLAITLACESLGTASKVRRAIIAMTPKQLRDRIARDRFRVAQRVGAQKPAPAR